MKRVLIIGGTGRIGSSIAEDLLKFTDAEMTITGRSSISPRRNLDERSRFEILEISNLKSLEIAIANADLVIHCAGPFALRDQAVLKTCIAKKVDYLDVSDDRHFTIEALSLSHEAERSGITAIINTGVFPGISNSLVRESVEYFDQVESIRLSYLVDGSGGAGLTVMRTTFLGLQNPFEVWQQGQWRMVQPYSEAEHIQFDHRKTHVHWFDVPEAYTLTKSFPVNSVTTKFGVLPEIYNQLTSLTARRISKGWLKNPVFIETLARVSYIMTKISDLFSGVGIVLKVEVLGKKAGKSTTAISQFSHPNTAKACGMGTGMIAQSILKGQLSKPGVSPVETAFPTSLFHQGLALRNLEIYRDFSTLH
ncbi:MAG: saccharopine dehydrogenase NADP-binding domain-containing protein [Anaerolineae bacterium]|nr:saccharopine dehydrogenase NADP-binding domain-containing protein [Gloeobacterales cyanobacterium ES-bin-313]